MKHPRSIVQRCDNISEKNPGNGRTLLHHLIVTGSFYSVNAVETEMVRFLLDKNARTNKVYLSREGASHLDLIIAITLLSTQQYNIEVLISLIDRMFLSIGLSRDT